MKVTWNRDSYSQFLAPVFNIKPDLEVTLLDDFISLKEGLYPTVFGKDGPYTAPGAIVSSRVYHVHLLLTRQERCVSRRRFACTSNRALIYSRHAKFPNVYSLLAIFPDNAHQLANAPRIMGEIAGYAAAFQALAHP
ncbi:type II toxin-antitoxin system YafO family toxin [Pluralibacter gergoviae]|uniref:type II toxin-antitoxin system YafO family toxin n=1 Tax=Pluralibacter gergoviae TaxID=61647 RepID=UPI000BFCD3D1|nr:type II toxin-antitoxin system YafO family toxin [Pluralibacter gergoviae]MCK1065431.1 type II toxin-antitoxin system YafO family toxin [Pluralibacter gergoviae]MCV7759014.1 type II toxin-antitoxin system YafO family toxin [Pluralibacter gergoviae]PHH46778.1 toxin YafO [Pluralibacter gergoviae]HDS1234580.1 type II toxin-antitoxin system YafO family toxin [Pluralibacter gergoviae]HDS1239742.1 type II toxin-antitoxin system YafO family toxin [Pluralibacter gergoviae]